MRNWIAGRWARIKGYLPVTRRDAEAARATDHARVDLVVENWRQYSVCMDCGLVLHVTRAAAKGLRSDGLEGFWCRWCAQTLKSRGLVVDKPRILRG